LYLEFCFLKGTSMLPILLLGAMLFQVSVPHKAMMPVIDNDRVTVWDLNDSRIQQPFDAVVVSLSASVEFVPKGKTPNAGGRSIVIDLKNYPVPAIANPTKYPLAFPRPGSKKILENDRVVVWDYTWTPDAATPMHFHDKDVVVVFLEDGDLSSTTLDGQVTVNSSTPGTVRFNPRGRTHTETLVRGKQHAIITELK
jgi:hypothetical protein